MPRLHTEGVHAFFPPLVSVGAKSQLTHRARIEIAKSAYQLKIAANLLRLASILPQPLICVTDVEASSRWYQCLLACRSAHGGKQYDQLVKNGHLVLQLHSFEVEHHHGPIGNPAEQPYGNGVLLWFEVDDFDGIMRRAAEMGVEMILPLHRNPPDGDGGPNHWECWIRDPDGYTVVVASPYGTADGLWRPDPSMFT